MIIEKIPWGKKVGCDHEAVTLNNGSPARQKALQAPSWTVPPALLFPSLTLWSSSPLNCSPASTLPPTVCPSERDGPGFLPYRNLHYPQAASSSGLQACTWTSNPPRRLTPMSLLPLLTSQAICRSAHHHSPLSHTFIPDLPMGDPLSSFRARVTRVTALEALLECSITERPCCYSLSQVCVCSHEDNNETTCSY